MYIGDVACPAGTVGIQAIVFDFGCNNFAMLVDTVGNTIINRPTGGKISFREGNGTDQVSITSGGLVGIGTTAPSGQLGVLGSTDTTAVFANGGDSSLGAGGAGIIATGGHSLVGGIVGGNGVQAIGGNGTVSGAVPGIGIAAIGGADINGFRARAGLFQGDIEVDGCIFTPSGDFGACSSDLRLKKNIEPLPAVLDKVAQLQPVSYNWRTEDYPQFRFSSGKNTGLIAQEVEKVFPDMVSTDQAGYKRVNYGELPYLMLEAIRELKAENDTLRERIERLEKAAASTR